MDTNWEICRILTSLENPLCSASEAFSQDKYPFLCSQPGSSDVITIWPLVKSVFPTATWIKMNTTVFTGRWQCLLLEFYLSSRRLPFPYPAESRTGSTVRVTAESPVMGYTGLDKEWYLSVLCQSVQEFTCPTGGLAWNFQCLKITHGK